MNFTDLTLNHIKEHGSITSMDAFNLYGNTRLSGTIWALRRRGIPIVSNEETSVNRFGRKVTYARYSILGDNLNDKRNCN